VTGLVTMILCGGAPAGCGHRPKTAVDHELTLYEEAFDESLLIQTSDLPPARVGDVYVFTLEATGHPRPLRWKVISGKVPEGFVLSPDGTLRGTPTVAAVTRFLVRVECVAPDPPSPYGGLPHICWRERQYTIVVRDATASVHGGAMGGSKLGAGRGRP
jgi:hypothetical protein